MKPVRGDLHPWLDSDRLVHDDVNGCGDSPFPALAIVDRLRDSVKAVSARYQTNAWLTYTQRRR